MNFPDTYVVLSFLFFSSAAASIIFMMQQQSMIASKLLSILGRIEQARAKHQIKHLVRLVAVSKTKTVQEIKQAYDAGQRHFGQNYVDEIEEKQPKLPLDIKWHFIGHLQSNKIKKIMVPNLELIETVDRQSLAEKLNKFLQKEGRKVKILIQLKTSSEDTKSGVDMLELDDLYQFIAKSCPFLQFKGLMTIGEQGDLSAFAKMLEAKKQLIEKYSLDPDSFQLSMGMSGDFQEAIRHHSTSVRVGSSIFGERTKKQ